MEIDTENDVIRYEAIKQRTGIEHHELLKGSGESKLFSFVFSSLVFSSFLPCDTHQKMEQHAIFFVKCNI